MQTYDLATDSAARPPNRRERTPEAPKPAAKPARLTSLDAYRGFIMLVLAGAGFGIAKVARKAIEQGDENFALWWRLEYHFSHPDWISQTEVPRSLGEVNINTFGCSAWDLIQPAFMFMVGVAMVYSYAKRAARGDSPLRTTIHVIARSLILVLLGVFLSSQWSSQTSWVFFNVLCQIGLGYGFVYLLLDREFPVQLAVAALLLVGYWAAFFFYPAPGPDFDYATRGVGAEPADVGEPAPLADEWVMPERFRPWTKNVNLAADFDRWLLNLFPRPKRDEPVAEPDLAEDAEEHFEFNDGGYTTLNFVPSIFTMLLGVMAGQLLRGGRRPIAKFLLLVLAGMVCMLLGAAAGATVCPVVKRIWTPSWALFSGAYVLWMLALFYLVIDVVGFRWWSMPLVVVGMNSIAVYVMAQSMKPWVAKMLSIHLGPDLIPSALKDALLVNPGVNLGQDGPYAPIVEAVMVLLVFWLICVWLYRQKIFIRV